MESPALQLHNYEPHNYTIPAALTRACQQDACRIRCLVRSCMARLQRVLAIRKAKVTVQSSAQGLTMDVDLMDTADCKKKTESRAEEEEK